VQHIASFANQDRAGTTIIVDVIEWLSEGCYIEVRLNEYYMPCRPVFKKLNYDIHINIIIGVDVERKKFTIAGFGTNYAIDELSFDDFLQSFFTPAVADFRDELSQYKWWKSIWIWRKKTVAPDLAARFPDFKLIARQLGEYINGCISGDNKFLETVESVDIGKDGAWGIKSYDRWEEYLAAVEKREIALDLRATRAFWEHKRCMVIRTELLLKRGFKLDDVTLRELKEVEEEARLIRLAALIYKRFPQSSQMFEIAGKIMKIKEKEERVLPNIHHALITQIAGDAN
jgi:hypothetical protein